MMTMRWQRSLSQVRVAISNHLTEPAWRNLSPSWVVREIVLVWWSMLMWDCHLSSFLPTHHLHTTITYMYHHFHHSPTFTHHHCHHSHLSPSLLITIFTTLTHHHLHSSPGGWHGKISGWKGLVCAYIHVYTYRVYII